MANTKSIRAGKAYVEVSADKSKLEKGLKAASRRLKAFGASVGAVGKQMAMIGTAGVTAGLAAVKSFAGMGDQLHKMSKRTGFSVEALSELSYAAKIGGTDIVALETGFKRMSRSIYDAGRGLSTANDALADLGLTTDDLKGKTPEEQFMILTQALSEVEDETTKAALALTLFGRAGTSLLPMIEGGTDSIDKLRKKARELGITMSTEDAEAAAEFTDVLTTLWSSVKMGVFSIGSSLAPMLQEAAANFMDNVKAVREWIGENKDLIVTIFKVAAGLAALGIALMVVGKVIGVFAGLVKMVSMTIVAVKALGVAFTWLLAHPVVLTFVAVTAAIVATVAVIKAATSETIKYSDAMQKLRAEGEKQRSADQLRMKRLEQLAAKESLTNDEKKEAAGLIGSLESAYGKLGITIDETTGKITGLADAMKLMRDAMMETAIVQLERELDEANENLAAAIKERKKALGGFYRDYDAAKEATKKQQKHSDRANEIRGRIGRLRGGDESELTGPKDQGDKIQNKIDLDKKTAENEAQWARKVEQLKLQAIEDRYAREKALTNERYDHEIKKAKAADATQAQLDDMEKARKLELARIEGDRQDAGREAAKEAAERAALEAEQTKDSNLSREETIEALKLRRQLKGIELEKALLELEHRRAIEAAKAAGERLDLVNEEYALRKQLLEKSDAAGQKSDSTAAAGTFSAAAIQSLQGYQSETKRTAEAAEKTAENTKKLLAQAKQGGLVFA